MKTGTLAKLYGGFCKAEEFIVSAFVAIITFLVFLSALGRFIGHPLNWAQDLSLLLFAWVVFLGADVSLRKSDFVRVDMLVSLFSPKVQKFLYYFWYVVTIMFLCLMVRYGFPLAMDNSKRLFQTLGITYSWATVSAPVGSILLIITIALKLFRHWNDSEIVSQGKEAI